MLSPYALLVTHRQYTQYSWIQRSLPRTRPHRARFLSSPLALHPSHRPHLRRRTRRATRALNTSTRRWTYCATRCSPSCTRSAQPVAILRRASGRSRRPAPSPSSARTVSSAATTLRTSWPSRGCVARPPPPPGAPPPPPPPRPAPRRPAPPSGHPAAPRLAMTCHPPAFGVASPVPRRCLAPALRPAYTPPRLHTRLPSPCAW